MNHMHNFLRKVRRMVPTVLVRLIRSTKIPLMLFGVCCYQFYHYQRIKTTVTASTHSQRMSIEPFSYELYDRIKDEENVIILLDMGYTGEFEDRLHGILSNLAEATIANPRKLRIINLKLNNEADKEEF